MNFFSKLGEMSLKVDADGNTLFYPYGLLTKAYIIGSPEHAAVFRRKWRWIIASMVGVIVVLSFLLTGIERAMVIAVWGAAYILWVYRETRGLARSSERLRWIESMLGIANAIPVWALYILALLNLVLVVAVTFVLLSQPEKSLVNMLAMALFGGSMAFWIFLLRLKRRSQSTT